MRLLLGLVGYDGGWRHMTPPPGGLKGSGGWEEKEETPARPARQQSRAPPGSPHAANHRKERSGVTSSAGDVTGFHHPVMPPLPP